MMMSHAPVWTELSSKELVKMVLASKQDRKKFINNII
jgi:hypothetical protein